jgi:copper resistance protein B
MLKKNTLTGLLLSAGLIFSHQAWSESADTPEMPGMESASHGDMQGGSAPQDARDPDAYSGDLRYNDTDLKRLHLMDQHVYKMVSLDHLERVFAKDEVYTAYELKAWIGKDFNKLQLQSEGEIQDGELEAHTELYWAHAVTAYWDTLLGVRFDSGDHERTWLGLGVQGLAPYWIDTSAKAFVDDAGRIAANLEFKYELMFTQDLELEPKLKAKFFSSEEAELGEGAGLAELKAGLRLKYHIQPELAPYVGVEWQGLFGDTRDLADAAGRATSDTRWVVGVSVWY